MKVDKAASNTTTMKNQTEHKTYTLQEVEAHRTCEDFWTVVDGVVYDLSSYAKTHPGGPTILNAAGSDCTVLFYTSHTYQPLKAHAVLSKYKIGVLEDSNHAKVDMGDFYRDCAERVRQYLQDKPRRPLLSKVYYLLDAAMATLLAYWGLFCLDRHTTPLWMVLVAHLLSAVHGRVVGQSHATGHLQIWTGTAQYIAELYNLALGFPGSITFGLPNDQRNDRESLNRPRSESQYEFGHGARGFAEHVAIHHVKGTDLEHDECSSLVHMKIAYRFSNQEPYIPLLHTFQTHFWYQCIMDSIGEGFFCGKILQIPEHFLFAVTHMIPQKQYVKAAAILFSLLPSLGCSWSFYCLAFSTQPYALVCFILVAMTREYLGCLMPQTFFAQHLWDSSVPEELSNVDWGRYNAETSYSWWPTKGWDLLHQPVLWCFPFGVGVGASSGTLSFHLEHTLFPCVNYLYLPEIAPIVRKCCQDHAIPYNGLYSREDLIKTRQAMLERGARIDFKTT